MVQVDISLTPMKINASIQKAILNLNLTINKFIKHFSDM